MHSRKKNWLHTCTQIHARTGHTNHTPKQARTHTRASTLLHTCVQKHSWISLTQSPLHSRERDTRWAETADWRERDSPALEIPHYNVTRRLKQQNSISRKHYNAMMANIYRNTCWDIVTDVDQWCVSNEKSLKSIRRKGGKNPVRFTKLKFER